jgi:hypothetical protein
MREPHDIDPLAEQVQDLARHEIGSLGPQLAMVQELLQEATHQYDPTAKAVLLEVRRRLVARLQAAVALDRWISVRTAAEVTRRPEGTVREWCRRGVVTARKVGGDWEIDRDSLYHQDERAA